MYTLFLCLYMYVHLSPNKCSITVIIHNTLDINLFQVYDNNICISILLYVIMFSIPHATITDL